MGAAIALIVCAVFGYLIGRHLPRFYKKDDHLYLTYKVDKQWYIKIIW